MAASLMSSTTTRGVGWRKVYTLSFLGKMMMILCLVLFPTLTWGQLDSQVCDMMGKAAKLKQDNKATKKELTGAAAVGATLGMMVAGPFMAVAGAVGATFMAATNQGDAGDIARASGRTAHEAFDKAKAFDKEHHVTEKVKDIAVNAAKRAKELDEEYHIVDRAKKDSKTAIKAAKEFNDKYKITDKIAKGFVQGLDHLNQALKEGGKNE